MYGDVQSLPVGENTRLNPKNAYRASKAAAEMYCSIFPGLEVVILRLANVYGPGDSDRVVPLFVSAALQGRPIVIFGDNKVLDLVWTEDVVNALWNRESTSSCLGNAQYRCRRQHKTAGSRGTHHLVDWISFENRSCARTRRGGGPLLCGD